MKQVPMAQSLLVTEMDDFTTNFRFLIPNRAASDGFAIERQATDGSWYFMEFLQPAQQLQDPSKYAKLRLVSGAVEIKSSTLPGGAFNLNGTFNA